MFNPFYPMWEEKKREKKSFVCFRVTECKGDNSNHIRLENYPQNCFPWALHHNATKKINEHLCAISGTMGHFKTEQVKERWKVRIPSHFLILQ